MSVTGFWNGKSNKKMSSVGDPKFKVIIVYRHLVSMNEKLIIFRKKKNLIKNFKVVKKEKEVGNTVSTGLPQ